MVKIMMALYLAAIRNMNPVTGGQVLAWEKREEAQGGQTAIIGSLKGNKEFDVM